MQIKLLFLILFFFPVCLFSQTKTIDSLELLLKTTKSDSLTIVIYLNLVDEYSELKNHKKCAELFQLATLKSKQSKKAKLEGKVLNSQGNYENRRGNHAKAQIYFIEAIDKYQKINYFKGLAATYSNLGITFAYQEKYINALKYLKLSLVNLEKYDYKLNAKADTYINLGNVSFSINKKEEGLKYLEEAMVIYINLKDKDGESYCLNNLANNFYDNGDFVKAKIYLLKTLELKLNNPSITKSNIVTTYNDLSSCDYKLKNFKQAHTWSLKALQLIDTSSYNTSLVNLYSNLAVTFEQQNELKKALFYQKEFFRVSTQLNLQSSNEEAIKKTAELEFKTKSIVDSLSFDTKMKTQDAKMKAEKWQKYALYGSLFVVILAAAFVYSRLRKTRKQNSIIHSQKVEVDEKNKQIIDSINYAQRIQQSLLTSKQFLLKYLPEHFLYFEPKDIVSGDFYWSTVTEDHFYLAICDSTGHGVPGAFMSVLNMSFLNEAIIEKKISQPNEIFNYVRKRLIESLPNDQDGMDAILFQFPLTVQNTIDFSNKVYYSAANNEPVLLQNEIMIKLAKDRMSVGKGYSTASFTNFELQLQKGDNLFLYTDGYADQFGGNEGKKYKSARLNQLLKDNAQHPITKQLVSIENEFQNWKRNFEQVDDVCVFGMYV